MKGGPKEQSRKVGTPHPMGHFTAVMLARDRSAANTHTRRDGSCRSTSQDFHHAMPMRLCWVLGSMVPKGPGRQLGIRARMEEGRWKDKDRETKAPTK